MNDENNKRLTTQNIYAIVALLEVEEHLSKLVGGWEFTEDKLYNHTSTGAEGDIDPQDQNYAEMNSSHNNHFTNALGWPFKKE